MTSNSHEKDVMGVYIVKPELTDLKLIDLNMYFAVLRLNITYRGLVVAVIEYRKNVIFD